MSLKISPLVWLELQKKSIVKNVSALKEKTGAKSPLVNVSANALGFGAQSFVRGLIGANVAGFVVDTIEEALELRRLGTNKTILVTEPITNQNLPIFNENLLIGSVYSRNTLEELAQNKIPTTIALTPSTENLSEALPSNLKLWGEYEITPNKADPLSGRYNDDFIFGTFVYGINGGKSVLTLRSRVIDVNGSEALIGLGMKDGFSFDFAGYQLAIGQIKEVRLSNTLISLTHPVQPGDIITIVDDLVKVADYLKITPWELSTRFNPSISREFISF
ncbi:alanine racemase [Xylocopilactobacillus apicola]|uniref:Alanine racemase C-terminal domain-containing protein n=1 Tax=Xylocopilactobacillus apicola TaxID=2932184 RepID=A0AAU9DDM2_9LACO|nr:alanine racemase [Xylocopilactobacillus apicola]BDR57900.1 hypothetical protein XA3_03410 [Xylocopilactobacillus apicola]